YLGAVGEDHLSPGEQLLLPGVDLRGVDVVLAGQLVDRTVSFVGRQGNLGLEPRRMNLPLEPHWFPSSGPLVYLNHWSRKRGPLHGLWDPAHGSAAPRSQGRRDPAGSNTPVTSKARTSSPS